MAVYQITTSGLTYSGSTNFFNGNTTYAPVQQFNLPGFLTVSGPVDARGVTGNGVNVLDIGLLVGTPFDLNPRPGETAWASNNALHDGFVPTRTGRASIDEVTQTYDPATNVLRTVIDPNVAPRSTLDTFIQNGGPLGGPRQIVAGEVVLDFSADFRTVTGSATFFGGGYIEPGAFAETLSFGGTLIG